jgi:hypothetical protein
MSCGVGTILWTILGRGRVAVASSAPLLPCPRAALLNRASDYVIRCVVSRVGGVCPAARPRLMAMHGRSGPRVRLLILI